MNAPRYACGFLPFPSSLVAARRLLTLLLLACVAFLPGPTRQIMAQEADAGTPYISGAKERYHLFVFGDRMATGLLAGIWRVLQNDPLFVARGRFNAGAGLVRVRRYDWQRAISQVLKSRPVDIGVVMLGVNDVHDIFIRGQRIPFGNDEWKTIYASRVEAIIQTFRDNGVALYWVGLPPVRDARLNAGVRLINELLRKQTQAHGVRFIDIYRHFAGPDDGFVFEGPDVNGRLVRLRALDGIRLIRPGNTKLATIVMNIIRQDVEKARATLATPGMPAAMPQIDKPFVGNAGPDGKPLFVPPSLLPGADVVYLARHGTLEKTARNALSSLREGVMPGSRAHALFVQGTWPAAPADRIDNFRLPPPADGKPIQDQP